MRLLVSLSLVVAVLFWTHPFYGSGLAKGYRAWSMQVPRSGKDPVLIRAPDDGQLPRAGQEL